MKKSNIWHKVVLTLCISGLALAVAAQQNAKFAEMRKNAQKLESEGKYKEAYDIYSEVLKDARTTTTLVDMVRVLIALDSIDMATHICREIIDKKDAPPIANAYWAQINMQKRNYAEALQAFLIYQEKGGKDPNILKQKAQCEKLIKVSKGKTQYIVRNEKKLNTDFNEFAPAMNGNLLIFSSNRPYTINEQMTTGKNQLFTYNLDVPPGMFISEYDKNDAAQLSEKERLKVIKAQQDDIVAATTRIQENDGTANSVNLFMSLMVKYPEWSKPETTPLSINLYKNNGPACFAANGNTLYISYVDNDGKSWLKTTHKLKDKKEWTYPMAVEFPKNWDKANIRSQCISADGSLLIVSAEGVRPSEGGYDLYMCRLQPDGYWGYPENLGSTINTRGDEMFPAFDAEGRLYFSSNGHSGFGGSDIFRTNGAINNWDNVENMGEPINSKKDDYGIMFYPGSSTSGLLVSNRPGGEGNDDIYSFDKIQGTMDNQSGVIAVKVINQDTRIPIAEATITLVTSKGETYSSTTAVNGQAFFAVAPNQKFVLSAVVMDDLYAPQSKIQGNQVQTGKTLEQTIIMKQVKFNKGNGKAKVAAPKGKASKPATKPKKKK